MAVAICISVEPGVSILSDLSRSVKGLLSWPSKRQTVQDRINSTVSPSAGSNSIPLSLDRFKAGLLRERNKVDHKGTRSLFGQAFQQLSSKPPDVFRLRVNDRAWKTNFVGEHATDAGGPYREGLSVMCQELQSTHLPLFTLCPNGSADVGLNRNAYIPVVSSTSSLHISMYEFLGKLMGLAMRTEDYLGLQFPPIIWKGILGDTITENDVTDVDIFAFNYLGTFYSVVSCGVILFSSELVILWCMVL